MDNLRKFDSNLFNLVRSYEGTRFVENLALERLVKDVDYFELTKSMYNHSCFVPMTSN
jgi:hypothetical protein